MFKGSDVSVAWVSPLPVQHSPGYHSSWAVLPDGTHAARLWKTPGEAFPLHSKIRAPPRKPTPVRLSCITTDKAQQDQSHWDDVPVPLNSKPFYRLPSETCNSISASCNALEIISLQRKQTEKEILQFSATPYTGHFFLIQQLYKTFPTVRIARSAQEFSAVLPTYCTVSSWCSCISRFSDFTEFLIKN